MTVCFVVRCAARQVMIRWIKVASRWHQINVWKLKPVNWLMWVELDCRVVVREILTKLILSWISHLLYKSAQSLIRNNSYDSVPSIRILPTLSLTLRRHPWYRMEMGHLAQTAPLRVNQWASASWFISITLSFRWPVLLMSRKRSRLLLIAAALPYSAQLMFISQAVDQLASHC